MSLLTFLTKSYFEFGAIRGQGQSLAYNKYNFNLCYSYLLKKNSFVFVSLFIPQFAKSYE